MRQSIQSLMVLTLLFLAGSGLWAQTILVSGTVVDGDMPLPT